MESGAGGRGGQDLGWPQMAKGLEAVPRSPRVIPKATGSQRRGAEDSSLMLRGAGVGGWLDWAWRGRSWHGGRV